MSISPTERINKVIGATKRRRKTIVSPEGIPLEVQIAYGSERLVAFSLDFFFMLGSIFLLSILFLNLPFTEAAVTKTVISVFIFFIAIFYFLYFELAWQGRTPGKKICKLRVINRKGGELTAQAIIARNMTRVLEIYIPILTLFNIEGHTSGWGYFATLGWTLIISSLPLWGLDRLRAGDLIGGTLVIAMPKRALMNDLSASLPKVEDEAYIFTHEQLAKYGAFELQVLEVFLRRPESRANQKQLEIICYRICAKIGWKTKLLPADVRRFLMAFYTAERADLEREQLFGRARADKSEAAKNNQKNDNALK